MGQIVFEPMDKLDRRNVSTYIKDIIMNRLLSGQLRPGDKLPTEMEFCNQLGVSRNSIREAIKMLSSIGIIEIRRGEGTFIRETVSESVLNPLVMQLAFCDKKPEELIELRIFFDTAVATLALEHLQDSDIELLSQLNEQILICIENNENPEQMSELDMKFHIEFIRITRNGLISRIGETIYKLFFASINNSVLYNENYGFVYQNHCAIIEAMKSRDQQKVNEVVKKSLTYWRKQLESAIS